MIKRIIVITLLSFIAYGDIISQQAIDTKKYVIQIASSKSMEALKKDSKNLTAYNLFLRNYKNRYYILYAVNIEKNKLQKTLEAIQTQYKSAFVTKQLAIYLEQKKATKEVKVVKSNSNTTTKQAVTTPIQNFSNLYQKALYSYNQKDFKDAYKYFAQYSQKNSMDKRGNFFYARSAFESAYYHEALAIYGKILLQDPNNVRVQLEIGQCYFRLNQYKKAKESFVKVLQNKLPQNVKRNILAMLQAIEDKDIKHFTQIMLMTGYVYDSNVDNSADAGEYTIYLPSESSNVNMTNNGDKTGDSSIQAVVVLNHKYKLEESLLLESKATGFTQQYFSEHDKNVDVLSLGTSLAKYKEDSKIALGVDYSYIWLGSDSYMSIPATKVDYTKKINSTFNYETYLKYAYKDYLQTENNDRDAHSYEFYNALNINTKTYGANTLSLTLGQEKNIRGIRTDVNKLYYTLNLTNNYSLSSSLLLKNSLEYKKSNYQDKDVNFLTKREDTQTTYSIGLTKAIDKNMSVNTNFQWVDNSSNHESFEYDKYVGKVFLFYGF